MSDIILRIIVMVSSTLEATQETFPFQGENRYSDDAKADLKAGER
mgnify:CR=1 FL=1